MNYFLARSLRQFFSFCLSRLEKFENKTPRSKKQAWYQLEFHVPPAAVGVASTFALFLTLAYGIEPTLLQAFSIILFVVILVGLFSFYLVKDHPRLAENDDAMSLLAVIFITTIFLIKLFAVLSHHFKWVSLYGTPVAIAPLIAALLLPPRLAVVLAFIMAMIFGMVNGYSLDVALVAAVGGVTVVAAGSRARNAHHIVRACIFVGLIQLFMVIFLSISHLWSPRQTWIHLVWSFGSGILTASFTLGVLPFLESFFSRISNLRLVELSDVNHPLLKKMSIEAPGTYHHSQIVASLAEEAANAIGANGLLCRVGAYFHDIGKMVKAEYFIENQGTFGNPHDQVSPSLSRLIITSHVKEGMALAKEYKLDPQVIDFIPQHHGTSQIEYFYQKALKIEEREDEMEKESVREETYRYPGPKPQNKETGLVMLSDFVEAASRTLEEPTHQRYQDLVYKIINKKLFDGQLDETPLTLKDLHIIAERFTATLQSVHHARVPYPEETTPSKKGKDREELSPPA